jgi:ribonuclease BN (tRNA processing enzyme)
VIVSHLHGDHFGGIPFVVLDAQVIAKRTAPLTVAGPLGVAERVTAATELLYPGVINDLGFAVEFVELHAEKRSKLGEIVITPEAASHGGGPSALSLRVECAGKVIAYSGDTGWTEGLTRAAAGADLFICECSLYNGEVDGHLSYRTLLERRGEFDCKRMILTHMGSDVLARLDDMAIETASDGRRIAV